AAQSDASEGSQRFAPAIEGLHEGVRRYQYNATGTLVAGRSRSIVTMQAAYTLEQHVGRSKVGNHEVGVYVEALFQSLGANDDQRTAGTAGTEPLAYFVVENGAILWCESTVGGANRSPALGESVWIYVRMGFESA